MSLNKKIVYLLFFAIVIFSLSAKAQSIGGKVINCRDTLPISGVAVRIAGTNMGVSTDSLGNFLIQSEKTGVCTLEFSFIGMNPIRKEIHIVDKKQAIVNVCMEEAEALSEVMVEARRDSKGLKEAKEQGVPVSVIDGKLLAGRGTSLVEVINHQTGVKVRRTGSDTKINVRELEGNRVQIYMDGYALNTPDGSFSINDIPLQFIDRIEIYKGIVPPPNLAATGWGVQ